jgi:lipopolysaccharide/colanic/teichoic acid biosynthesis glycosyltransferase
MDVGASAEVIELNSRVPQWKRALDVTVVLLSMPLTLPVITLIALAIKIVSRGPILFRQERIGLTGKSFVCLKFRTMRVDAPTAVHQGYFKQLMESDEPMTKMDSMGDPRLIPLGSLLRASGMDELPQLFNVFRGDMSVVGPRPCTPFEFSNYHPWQKQRFNTLPGLTGLWQVSGKNKTTFNEMIRLDIRYCETQTIWLDLGIILRTIPVVLGQVKELVSRVHGRTKAALVKVSK